jgi:hypothetical protein
MGSRDHVCRLEVKSEPINRSNDALDRLLTCSILYDDRLVEQYDVRRRHLVGLPFEPRLTLDAAADFRGYAVALDAGPAGLRAH